MTQTTSAKPWTHQQYDNIHALIAGYNAGERPRLHFTRHAAQRFREMGLTHDEVFAAVANPEHVRRAKSYDAMNISSGRITLGVALDNGGYPNVTTILWWTDQDWKQADTRGRIGRDRVLRPGAVKTKPRRAA
ncbi:MAG: DUF4258 domain-containing protein [Microbacterium sp.]|uniref:hypothetical protein n=1 Tax=Microbacterium sp. TaxID=51671 RepID=UPI0025DE7D99|nr:hypothetical protein [Microbacterium sp.]MBQ9917423.1 DUF4258 domain-containing protein [Microbacterium sp.]